MSLMRSNGILFLSSRDSAGRGSLPVLISAAVEARLKPPWGTEVEEPVPRGLREGDLVEIGTAKL